MEISLIQSLEEFQTIKMDWEAVYKSDPQTQFFLSWVWLSEWFQIKSEPWFVLAAKPHSNSSYVAFLPMGMREIYKEGFEFYNELYMGGNHLADYTGFLCLPEYEKEAMWAFHSYLVREFKWLYLELKDVLDTRINQFLAHFSEPQFESHPVVLKFTNNYFSCPYISLPPSWEQYLQELSSSNTRQKLRRCLRKIDRSEELKITPSQTENINRHIEILLKLWQTQWEEKNDRELDCLRKMFRHCFENNCLYLPILWYKDEPIVANANFIDFRKKTLLFYITGRDDRFNNPPPGITLHAHSIRYAIENGLKVYDFLRGDEAYKFSFGAIERFIQYIQVKRKI